MKPLDQITLHPRDHKAALSWLKTLFCHPTEFDRFFSNYGFFRSHAIYLIFLVHIFPYWLFLSLFAWVVFLANEEHFALDSLSYFNYRVMGLLGNLMFLSLLKAGDFILAKRKIFAGMFFLVATGTYIAFQKVDLSFLLLISLPVIIFVMILVVRAMSIVSLATLAFSSLPIIPFNLVAPNDKIIPFYNVYNVFSHDYIDQYLIQTAVIFGLSASVYGNLVGRVILSFFTAYISSIPYSSIQYSVNKNVAFEALTTHLDVIIVCGLLSFIISYRAYYWLYHLLFIVPNLKPQAYPNHPVAWDDRCEITFIGLDKLLAGYAEIEPESGNKELARLIDNYPPQRMTALRAKVRLIARSAGHERHLFRLDEIVANVPEGEKGFLKHTAKIKVEIAEIASLQRRLDVQTRRYLKEPEAALIVEKIRNFQSRVSGYPEPLGSEFRKAAGNWLNIAEAQYQQLRSILDREPRPQVFRAGDPVDREQEAFIPRFETLGELDRQLSLASGCPGLILYGRRRMGKSTLLRNLEDFLPVSVRISVLPMQNPEAFTSLAYWLNWVSEPVRAVWPERDRPEAPDSLPSFFRLLGECNKRLEAEGQRLLLAIDEYENIDRKLGEGVFPMDLLDMLRESIQTHRRNVWLFAGSHAIEELTHAEWPSYLISARTVEVPAFSEAETRLLLTEPMKHSRLFERDESKRPRFEPGFWGEDGIARIQAETAGWPHLVQLLAETAVDLCNERQRPLVDAALLDDAIAKAVTAGDTVLRQLLKGESTEADWAWLVGFRRLDALPIPEDEAVFLSLRRRWLVVDVEPGQWRLRVPLLLRWLRERG